MSKTLQTLTISLPEAMLQEVQRVSREENRTYSELVREALRRYFSARFPAVRPSNAELAGIAAGRAEIEKGDFVTLPQLLNGLESQNRKPRRKSGAKTSHS